MILPVHDKNNSPNDKNNACKILLKSLELGFLNPVPQIRNLSGLLRTLIFRFISLILIEQ